MKKLLITLAILLISSTCSAAWVDVVNVPDYKFSVKQESIQHYVSKLGNNATSGIYNYYDYRTNSEVSNVIAINDETYMYRVSRSCTWKNGAFVSCNDRNDVLQAERGTNAWTIMQYMVNYNRTYRGNEGI